ncbi:MAG: hypothetical protein K0R15_978 [Clostridiales bacterium]|jgi:hypothetical protein|nr:hypothetical protein [Clostridiales bacterium]
MVKRGSITIFLCLILSTVMIVVSSLTEVVRIRSAYTAFDRKLQVALNSVMANYDQHLFDDYGILAFDSALEGNTVNEDNLQNLVYEYIVKNTMKGVNETSFITNLKYQGNFIDLYQFNIDKISSIENQSIVDNKAEYLKQQIVDNMKYKIVLVGINKFTDLSEAVEKSKVTSTAIEKKAEVDAVAQKLSTELIDLIQGIDGIEFKKGRPKVNKGQYCIVDSFVKKLSITNPTMESQKINNLELFEDINPTVYNIVELFDLLINEYRTLQNLIESRDSIDNQKTEFKLILNSSTDSTQEQIDKLKAKIKELDDYIKSYDTLIEESNEQIREKYNTLKTLIQDNAKANVTTQTKVNQYKTAAVDLISMEELYKIFLEENKKDLTEEIYTSLYPDSSGGNSKYGNIQKIDETISENVRLYNSNEITILLNLNTSNNSKSNISSTYQIGLEIKIIENAKKILSKLSNDYLEFDYSGYSIKGIEEDDPRDTLSSIASGKLEDYEDLTGEKNIDIEGLPSKLLEVATNEISEPDFDEQQYTKDAFTGFATSADTSGTVSNMLEATLVNEYIMGTFMSISDYSKSGNKTILCDVPFEDRALNYEIEYIIAGKNSDLKNKVSVAAKLLLIRFCFNFIHAIADSEKRGIALSLATAIVGPASAFGMNYIVQFLLLGAWALAESAYDVQQLFKGEKLPIIKSKEDWKTSITGAIKETIDNEEEKGFNVGYEDYLRLILMTSTSEQERLYRSMDLMQLNLQKQYGEGTHQMENMLYEFDIEGTTSIKSIFLPKAFNFFTDSNNTYFIKARKRRAY